MRPQIWVTFNLFIIMVKNKMKQLLMIMVLLLFHKILLFKLNKEIFFLLNFNIIKKFTKLKNVKKYK